MLYKATVIRSGALLGNRLRSAESFWQRAIGLLATPPLKPGEGLILPKTNQVHMFGMRYPLDLVFLSSANEVVRLTHSLAPWRVSPKLLSVRSVVELPAGLLDTLDIQTGDTVQITKEPS